MQRQKGEAADGDAVSNISTIHLRADDEIKKHKLWVQAKDIEKLKKEDTAIPNRTIDCIELLLLHHLAATDNY